MIERCEQGTQVAGVPGDSGCTAAWRGGQETDSIGAGSQELGRVLRVASERQANALYAEIVRPDRRYPIVGLTCRAGTRDPALASERVQEGVWPGVPIYVIEPRESRTLNDLLPRQLGAYNGAARVWWPGVNADCSPTWHPLIHDSRGIYGEAALDRLAAEFAAKCPESIHDLSAAEQAEMRARLRVAQKSGLLVSVARPKDLRRLTGDLRRLDRDYPIVVLSLGEGASEPSFPPSAVRSALEPHIPVYVLVGSASSRRLEHALGPELVVRDGCARVFWPGVGRDSDPLEHPLVRGGRGEDTVERLIAVLNLSRPDVRGHVAGTQERLQSAQERAADAQRELRVARVERDAAVARADAAEASLAALEQQLRALQEAGLDKPELEALATMDGEAIMQRLICREWLRSLQAADRRVHLLGGYRFGSQFLASVEDRRIAVPPARVAFACAMVVCGRAAELPGLEPHPWREGRMSGSGDDPQAVRADGGRGLMCNLGHGRGAARLFYWALADGVVEFDSVRNHKAIGQRG